MCVTINLETGKTFLLTTDSLGPNNTLPPAYWLDGQTYFTIYNTHMPFYQYRGQTKLTKATPSLINTEVKSKLQKFALFM